MKKEILGVIVTGFSALVLCSCSTRAGTTVVSFNPFTNSPAIGTHIYYGQNPAITNQWSATNLWSIATMADAGTNSRVVISGITGTNYFNATTYSATAESDTASGVTAIVPTNGLTLILTNRL